MDIVFRCDFWLLEILCPRTSWHFLALLKASNKSAQDFIFATPIVQRRLVCEHVHCTRGGSQWDGVDWCCLDGDSKTLSFDVEWCRVSKRCDRATVRSRNILTVRAGLTAGQGRANKLPDHYRACANQPVWSMNVSKILYPLMDGR